MTDILKLAADHAISRAQLAKAIADMTEAERRELLYVTGRVQSSWQAHRKQYDL